MYKDRDSVAQMYALQEHEKNPTKKLKGAAKQQKKENKLRVVLFAEGSESWSSCLYWVSRVFH